MIAKSGTAGLRLRKAKSSPKNANTETDVNKTYLAATNRPDRGMQMSSSSVSSNECARLRHNEVQRLPLAFCDVGQLPHPAELFKFTLIACGMEQPSRTQACGAFVISQVQHRFNHLFRNQRLFAGLNAEYSPRRLILAPRDSSKFIMKDFSRRNRDN